MKTRLTGWHLGAIGALSLVVACGGGGGAGSGDETATLTLAHVFPAESLEHEAAQRFAEVVAEETDGAVNVEIYPASQLGGFEEIASQQQSGAVDVTIISTTALGGETPTATVDSWPYLFQTKEEFDRAYESDAGKEFLQAIEDESGYKLLAPTYKGTRELYLNQDVADVNDLRNLKVRVPGLDVVTATFESWGMNPTPMEVSEIFTSMQSGVVNGIEIEEPTAASMGLPEVTKSVVLTHHMMPNYAWIMWSEWFDGQSEEVQAALEEAASTASAEFSEKVVPEEDAALKAFEQAGAKIVEVDTAQLQSAADEKLRDELPDLAEWADRLRDAGKG